MRRHAMLLSLVGVLLLTLSIPAVAKKGPPSPDQSELPPCWMNSPGERATGEGSFTFTEMCEWLPDGPGKWQFTVVATSTANLQLGVKDAAPGNGCFVVDARGVIVTTTYDFQPDSSGSYKNACPLQEGDRIDWADGDEEFVVWVWANPSKVERTLTITYVGG